MKLWLARVAFDQPSHEFFQIAYQSLPTPPPKEQVLIIGDNLKSDIAGGNNFGLNHTSGEYIFFVNNDTILEKDCLVKLMTAAKSLKQLGAISPKFHYYHTENLIEYAGCPAINIFTARTKIIGSRKKLL